MAFRFKNVVSLVLLFTLWGCDTATTTPPPSVVPDPDPVILPIPDPDPVTIPGQAHGLYVGGSQLLATGQAAHYDTPGYWVDGVWKSLALDASAYPNGAQVTGLAVTADTVYAVGLSPPSGGATTIPILWTNGVAQALPIDLTAFPYGYSTESGPTVVVNGSDVYVSGTLWGPAATNEAGYWKNGTWHNLLSPTNFPNGGEITSIVVSGSDVYAFGYADGGTAVPGYFKNSVWIALPVDTSTYDYGGGVTGLSVSGASVIAVGWLNSSSGTSPDVTWTIVGGVSGTATVLSFGSSSYPKGAGNSPKYASASVIVGNGLAADNTWHAGLWNAGTWSELDSNPSYAESGVVAGSDVYVVGKVGTTIGTWKNGVWTPIALEAGAIYPTATAVVVY